MDTPASPLPAPRFGWLPEQGSWKFHLLLSAVAIFILGPLGGIAAAYMNFSLGFFVGGQVLAGILGSVVTYGYGARGQARRQLHADDGRLGGLDVRAWRVLIQAMVWLGMPQPPAWQLMLFVSCIGMFGVGRGHALHAAARGPDAARLPLGLRGRQHPARAHRQAPAEGARSPSSAAARGVGAVGGVGSPSAWPPWAPSA